ncbi:MAG: hypothetical protein E6G39_08930, partial [Actinobacteria bacterium]
APQLGVLRPALCPRRRGRHPTHVPSHLRGQAVRRRLGRSDQSKDHHRGHRLSLLRRRQAVHLHGDEWRLRPHPGLKFVGAEVNFAWLPFWAQTMEQNFDIRSTFVDEDSIETTLRPTEYLGRNLFVTVLDDYMGFELIERYPYLADTAMFSTDYPHSVTLWPNSKQHLAKLTKGVDPAAVDKIVSVNAERVYGL